ADTRRSQRRRRREPRALEARARQRADGPRDLGERGVRLPRERPGDHARVGAHGPRHRHRDRRAPRPARPRRLRPAADGAAPRRGRPAGAVPDRCPAGDGSRGGRGGRARQAARRALRHGAHRRRDHHRDHL
ncbi:MAG: Lactam utilization protein LamB, partial [uncultured Actinomycetospora sp.]